MGSEPNGADSIAKQIVPASHWPEMRILILVVNDAKKKSFQFSWNEKNHGNIWSCTIQNKNMLFPERMKRMEQAIVEKDFKTFAEHTMKDSNQMHAVCLDAYPPFVYMNDVSHAIVDLVHAYNEAVNEVKVAYTFDAGPNATLYLLEESVPEFMGVLNHFFPPGINLEKYRRGLPLNKVIYSPDLFNNINAKNKHQNLLNILFTLKLEMVLSNLEDPKDHLLNKEGLPIS